MKHDVMKKMKMTMMMVPVMLVHGAEMMWLDACGPGQLGMV